MSHCQWRVLPQGMTNSPATCELCVHQALLPVHSAFPSCLVYHYVDDVLLAAPTQSQLLTNYRFMTDPLSKHALQIAHEKLQLQRPWNYQGYIFFN